MNREQRRKKERELRRESVAQWRAIHEKRGVFAHKQNTEKKQEVKKND